MTLESVATKMILGLGQTICTGQVFQLCSSMRYGRTHMTLQHSVDQRCLDCPEVEPATEARILKAFGSAPLYPSTMDHIQA